jgi:hypothetical protein
VSPKDIQNIEAIRLHLYRHRWPSGSLRLALENENGRFATSEDVAISSIGQENFFHGQVRFFINAQVRSPFQIVLEPVDYAFSESAYVGWCSDFDFKTYHSFPRPLQSPLDYEMWTRVQR